MSKQRTTKNGDPMYNVCAPIARQGQGGREETKWVKIGICFGGAGKNKDAFKILTDGVLPAGPGWDGSLMLFPMMEDEDGQRDRGGGGGGGGRGGKPRWGDDDTGGGRRGSGNDEDTPF